MIELGQTVGNYRVIAKIGEGGMGDVYLAEHPVIGRRAALKVIHPQHARNAQVVTRFVNEATAINRIGHEHIVEVTDFGRTPGGDFYFVMEYLEGHALAELIAREAPLPPARALGIAAQIADALSASHAHGVIHRDIKPDNIFLVARGDDSAFVKVLDFGLAKLSFDHAEDAGVPNRTRTGTVMGTPQYMAPEQCEGRSELDQRADIYSLGVVLFEMLTGKLPFDGAGYAEVFMKQLTMRPPAARSLVPTLPEPLDRILARALAKAPTARFPTMTAFREALLDPEGLGISSRVAAPRKDQPASPESHGASPERDGDLDRVPRQYRAARTAILVGAAALTGMLFAAGLTSRWVIPAEGSPAVPLSITKLAPSVDAKPQAEATTQAEAAPQASTASRDEGDPPLSASVAVHRHHRRPRPIERVQDDDDADGVLVPSFVK